MVDSSISTGTFDPDSILAALAHRHPVHRATEHDPVVPLGQRLGEHADLAAPVGLEARPLCPLKAGRSRRWLRSFFDRLRHVVHEPLVRAGAGPRVVLEDVVHEEPLLLEEAFGPGEVLIGLAGEADDPVAAELDVRDDLAEQVGTAS